MAYNQGPAHSVLFDASGTAYDPNQPNAYETSQPSADYTNQPPVTQGGYAHGDYYDPSTGYGAPEGVQQQQQTYEGLQFYNSQYDPNAYGQAEAPAGGMDANLDPQTSGFYTGSDAAGMGATGSFEPYPVGVSLWAAFGSGGLPGEPPLLEELGVNFGHIKTKSLTVLNPVRSVPKDLMDDADMSGPLIFVLLFGTFLLFSGKVHFGYIYGVGLLGCLSVYALLNLMSDQGMDGYRTTSVLGYSLLPMVLLSGLSLLLKLSSSIGYVLSCFAVLWCTYAASTVFVSVLSMTEQRLLVAYPVGLFYTCFALMTVF
ncbi:hypothetical protein IWQ62_006045 [Dispira parvispora]|uniref:Protein YIP n=1 Tax=Dispira parvispora TaxID=1520584 RepID=A0A9W8DZ01_9FUNG|nr:hypothetical protein IWQ62_006045 [Dispira parvispora]